jgi:hypothetical protein
MSSEILVATRKGLFRVVRRGTEWKIDHAMFLGDNVTMALPDPRDGSWYAAIGHGHFGVKMKRSTNRGETWDDIAAPTYPEKPADLVDNDPMRGTPVPWSLQQVWSLEGGGSAAPQRLWCGTIPGGLFRSEDRGQTWNLVRSLWDHPKRTGWFGGGADYPGIHSICVNPRSPDELHLGISCGGVWYSADAGESWELRATGMVAAYLPPGQEQDPNTQDPHRVVQCAAAPQVLWAQHHNGVFRSTDSGRLWDEVKNVQPSVFGFAVAVHPRDPDTAWFVPAIKDERRIPVDGKVVVSRTRDGGRTFDVLRHGLPQEHAYDLTYRHGLDIDATGRSLAFGSTTGGLWISEDQGDRWALASAHLPPVYCVRFIAE